MPTDYSWDTKIQPAAVKSTSSRVSEGQGRLYPDPGLIIEAFVRLLVASPTSPLPSTDTYRQHTPTTHRETHRYSQTYTHTTPERPTDPQTCIYTHMERDMQTHTHIIHTRKYLYTQAHTLTHTAAFLEPSSLTKESVTKEFSEHQSLPSGQ